MITLTENRADLRSRVKRFKTRNRDISPTIRQKLRGTPSRGAIFPLTGWCAWHHRHNGRAGINFGRSFLSPCSRSEGRNALVAPPQADVLLQVALFPAELIHILNGISA